LQLGENSDKKKHTGRRYVSALRLQEEINRMFGKRKGGWIGFDKARIKIWPLLNFGNYILKKAKINTKGFHAEEKLSCSSVVLTPNNNLDFHPNPHLLFSLLC
jgi:hypothetical protein